MCKGGGQPSGMQSRCEEIVIPSSQGVLDAIHVERQSQRLILCKAMCQGRFPRAGRTVDQHEAGHAQDPTEFAGGRPLIGADSERVALPRLIGPETWDTPSDRRGPSRTGRPSDLADWATPSPSARQTRADRGRKRGTSAPSGTGRSHCRGSRSAVLVRPSGRPWRRTGYAGLGARERPRTRPQGAGRGLPVRPPHRLGELPGARLHRGDHHRRRHPLPSGHRWSATDPLCHSAFQQRRRHPRRRVAGHGRCHSPGSVGRFRPRAQPREPPAGARR